MPRSKNKLGEADMNENEQNGEENDSKRIRFEKGEGVEEESVKVNQLLDWWFLGKCFEEQSSTSMSSRRESYSDAARSRWFANGVAQKQADAFINDHWGERMVEISNWCVISSTLSKVLPPSWVNIWTESSRGSLALIILLDQFSRHIRRVRPEEVDVAACSKQARCEVLSHWSIQSNEIQLLNQYQSSSSSSTSPLPNQNENHQDDHLLYKSDDLKCNELVFLLMPFRHDINASQLIHDLPELNKRRQQLKMTLNELDERQNSLEEELALLQRFRKQTTRALNVVDDTLKSPKQHLEAGNQEQEGSWMLKYSELLERLPFQANEDLIEQEPLVKTMNAFLTKWFVDKQPSLLGGPRLLVPLSLSGGVDSMVLLKVLSLPCLRDKFGYDVLSLHINYGNRPEAGREAAFVTQYALDAHSGSRVEVLEIGGGRNNGTMSRDEFETSSRRRRFQFYKASMKKHSTQAAQASSLSTVSHNETAEEEFSDDEKQSLTSGGVGVMLAHHLGDVEENVLSNVLKGCMPDKLSGMKEVGVVEGCHVWRPLLPWRKDTILDFAHKYGVPYFLDSTPSWSTRYSLRNVLLPAIADTYGEGAHRNLACLAKDSDDLHAEIQTIIVQPFIEQSKFTMMGVEIVTTESIRIVSSILWWKLVLMPILHKIKNPMLSEKALHVLIRRLNGTSSSNSNQSFMKPLNQIQINKKKLKSKKSFFKNDYQLFKYEESKMKKLNNSEMNQMNNSDHMNHSNTSKSSELIPSSSSSSSTISSSSSSSNSVYPKDGWLELRKEYCSYLQHGNLFVFKQNLFPQRQQQDNKAILSHCMHEIEKSNLKANEYEYHIKENSPLPLPSCSEVFSFLASRNSFLTELRSSSVRWGPWLVTAVVRSVCNVPLDQHNTGGHEGSPPPMNIVISDNDTNDDVYDESGMVVLKGDVSSWLHASKLQKQARALPIDKFPCLNRPILGQVTNSQHQNQKNAPPFSDMKVLMTGKFHYSLLMPLPWTKVEKEEKTWPNSWEYELRFTPSARLLPLRHLDQNLRRMIPVVAPQLISEKITSQLNQTRYCIVDIEYQYIE